METAIYTELRLSRLGEMERASNFLFSLNGDFHDGKGSISVENFLEKAVQDPRTYEESTESGSVGRNH